MPNPRIKHNSWEYPDMDPGKVPMWVRNCADPKKVGQFLEQNEGQLTDIEKEYLTHKRDSLQKLTGKISEVQKQVQEKTYAEQKPEILADAENGIYVLQGIDQPSFQTADNGCWSSFYQMLLQSRGVKDITQEDIRAYRPTLPEGEQFGENTSTEMNSDVRNNMLEMGDLALDLMPDTMIKSVDIVSYHSFKNGVGEDDIEKLTYSSAIEEAVKQQIIEAVRDHHSPVGLMMDGHYLTITGIEGNTVYYKNSMPPEGDEQADPNATHTANLSELLYPAINGVNADSFSLTWVEDIKLAKKDNVLYNTASPLTTVSEDGTVVNGALQEQFVFSDERRQKGVMIGCTGGIDLPEDEAGFRQHLKPGFFKTEKTYLPKKLNMESLRQKAADRPDEEEKALSEKRQQIIAERDAYRKEIEPQKNAQKMANEAPPAPIDPRQGRFVVPTTYSGKRVFFGNTNSYRAFRGLFAITNHFNAEKDEPLLDAIANLYDIHDPEANPEHKAAMDIVMSNLKAGKEDPDDEDFVDPISVSTYKSNLKQFYDAVVNGTEVYDDKSGRFVMAKGAGDAKLAEYQQKSLQYLDTYIKVLEEIEKIEPSITIDKFDADGFIDPRGQVQIQAIQNDPVIKGIAEKNAQRRQMQESIGYGQDGRSILGGPDAGPYQGGKSLLASADWQYTGDFGYAADNTKQVVEVMGDQDYYTTFASSLVYRGLPRPKNRAEENVYRAMYNLLTYGGKEYDQLNQKTLLTADQLDDVVMNATLTALYDLNFSTAWPKNLQSSVQCITDCLVRREETAFAKLETAYFSGDAKTFAAELVGWERKELHQKDTRGFTRYYSNAVQTALSDLKKEFAACKPGDEKYEFYARVQQEIDAISKAGGARDPYTKAACGKFGGVVQAGDRKQESVENAKADDSFSIFDVISGDGPEKEKQSLQSGGNAAMEKQEKQEKQEKKAEPKAEEAGHQQPADMIDPPGTWISKAGARQYYKECLEMYQNAGKAHRLHPDNAEDLQIAANAIVCSVLLTEGAKQSVFGHTILSDQPQEGCIRINERGLLHTADIASCVKTMATHLLQEPEILKVAMLDARDAKGLYTAYRNQLRVGMDRQVAGAKSAEEAADRKAKRNHNNIMAEEGPKEMVRLSAKDLDFLKRTRKELKDLYMLDGAFRSSYMEKLYNSLDRLVNTATQNGRMADRQELTGLKNKALVYYDKRKGVIMGPVTDKGKARLEIVENLTHRLEKMEKPAPAKKMGK
ncbi:MAG: hypothetical protein IK078_05875 [Lachnospiraceae bacterium]|nr:hypothetical protein [Lachnospiraceae bacterium]